MEKLIQRFIRPTNLTILLVGLIFFFCIWNLRWFHSTDRMSGVISSDGEGYYYYMPAIFIKGDLQPEKPDPDFHVKTENGNYVNKYPFGTALLILPFFFLATACSWLFGYPIDGYSAFFQASVSLAALFYFLAGIALLLKTIRQFIALKPYQEIFTLCVIAFGTPLSYYVLHYPSLSHVYSFFLINLIIWLFVGWKNENQVLARTGSFLVLGIAIVTRPTHVLILVFLPFLFSSFSELIAFAKKYKPKGMEIFALLLPVSVQMILWKMQSENWLMWSYEGEGFYFTQPHIIEFLFGFRKGFFIYAPLFVLFIPALLLGWKEHRYKMWIAAFFILITAYIFSSWYNWFYADLFAMRPMIDFSGAFILAGLILLFRNGFHRLRAGFVVVFSIISIAFNLLFSYQFHHGIIHPNGMNAGKFLSVFLKTGERYHHALGGSFDLPPYAPKGLDTLAEWKACFENESNDYRERAKEEFPLGKDIEINDHWVNAVKLWVQAKFKIEFPNTEAGKNFVLVIQLINSKKEVKYYFPIPLREYINEESGKFLDRSICLSIYNTAEKGDTYSAYIWNRDQEMIVLKDFELYWLSPKK